MSIFSMVEPDMNYSTHNVPIDLPGASVAGLYFTFIYNN